MTFSETGRGNEPAIDQNREQLNAELASINQERKALGPEVGAKWPELPDSALTYLAEICAPAELMSLAVEAAHKLLTEDPAALDDPDIAPFLLDDCIAQAEIAALDKGLQQDAETITANEEANEQRRTTIGGLTYVKNICAELPDEQKRGPDAIINVRARLAQDLKAGKLSPEANQEAQKYLNQVEAMLAEMTNVFVDSPNQPAFTALLSSVPLALGADSLSATVAPIMDAVMTSDKFTPEDKQRLLDVVTGSDAQAVMAQTITDENGVSQPRYTQKYQREFRSGVSGYSEGSGRQIIEGRAGDHVIIKDVTGWSGEDVGLLIETMHMWHTLEGFGATGFVESVYKLDFSVLGDGQAFDPIQITQMRQVLSHLVGGFEGMDGDIAKLEDKKTLLHNQARLLSETQTAFGWENDQASTLRVVKRLGMQAENDKPNLEVIRAFGDYTQRNFGGGEPDQFRVVEHLHKMYPQFVAPVSEAEKAGNQLKNPAA